MHFRILKMIATSGFLTASECTKFVFGPHWGSLQRSPRLPSWIKGALLLRGMAGERTGGEGEGEERREGEEKGPAPPFGNSWIRPCHVREEHTVLPELYNLTCRRNTPSYLNCFHVAIKKRMQWL